MLERRAQRVGSDRAEIEALHPREDRRRDLARIRGREHEDDVRRRLLQRLQQGIERGLGQLVDLVDDVDLVLAARRRVLHVLAERPDLFDAPVRGAVDLDHVDERAGQALDAHRALAAGLGARARGTEQRARQQAGRRGLADAPRAGEQVGVRDAARSERVPQRARDRILTDDRIERLRPPLSSENLIAHGLTGRLDERGHTYPSLAALGSSRSHAPIQ